MLVEAFAHHEVLSIGGPRGHGVYATVPLERLPDLPLIGPVLGAAIVNGAKSWLTVAYPEFWLYFLGALFIAVTLFLPQGIVGLFRKFKKESGQ